ncbi:MAG TPA: M57 family metalloprotease [Pedobacter sp.]|nr:M57 family metalloprotease [Pedobacter sp.]
MKNKNLFAIAMSGIIAVGMYSCKNDENTNTPKSDEISKNTLSQIASLGFSTDEARKVSGGYLVEGDIFLTEENLTQKSTSPNLTIAETEQYRTTNLVTSLPRVITISVTNLPTVYSDAVDLMISRYNSLGLRMTFQRAAVGTTGNIDVFGFNEGPSGGYITLGSSGFPTSSGQPYSQVKMNTNVNAYGTNPNLLYVASVLQHEVGHCIGFRHTDYMNRAYSCGGRRSNEGSAGIGAIQIPGTPSKADANSFMLACSNGGDRTFNANDVIALNYLYK